MSVRQWVVVFCVVSLIFTCAYGQKDEVLPKRFDEYKAKAEKGEAEAQYCLGVCYNRGLGVAKDSFAAVKWYRKAAEQNFASAQYNLGACYFRGTGVEKDYAEAVKWYRKAASLFDRRLQRRSQGRCGSREVVSEGCGAELRLGSM